MQNYPVDRGKYQIFSVLYLFTGEFVTMTGSLFSDRYGSNLPSASNGRPEKLLRYEN